MNSDRLIVMQASEICNGLSTKWNSTYPFLGYSFWVSSGITGDTFGTVSSIHPQDGLDIAYYLENEDLFFLLYQLLDGYIVMSNGTSTVTLTTDNIKSIIQYKWNMSIASTGQTWSSLTSIGDVDDTILFTFMTFAPDKDIDMYMVDTILGNFFETYFTKVSSTRTTTRIYETYVLNWDQVKSRYSYRFNMNWPHLFSVNATDISLTGDTTFQLVGYMDGIEADNVTFVSSNLGICTVTNKGVVKGTFTSGVATITITIEGLSTFICTVDFTSLIE